MPEPGGNDRRVNGADGPLLLERERELATLDRLVHAAVAGDAGVGLIEGAAGIGKSRLLTEARHFAVAAGMRVLRGAAVNRSGSSRCVVRQLSEPAIAPRDETTELTSLFSGAAHAARAVFELSPDDDDDAVTPRLRRCTGCTG